MIYDSPDMAPRILNSSENGQSKDELHPVGVSELSRTIKSLIEDIFPVLCVRGEITNLRRPSSGHIYLSLKEGTDQIRVVWFSGRQKTSARLEEGRAAVVEGVLSSYGPQSCYQIIADRIRLEGAGDLEEELRRLREKLEKEGLFDEEKKQPLPYLPRRVAIVTSPTGAAIRDILNVIRRRFPGADLLVYPAPVQGENAGRLLAEAVNKASNDGRCDLLILTRGGGSREDLWCFNDESLVRAVAACPIPTISAVGHEIDFVLTDLAADRRALTPSEAAEIAFPERDALDDFFMKYRARLQRRILDQLRWAREKLGYLENSQTIKRPERMLEKPWQDLDRTKRDLALALKARIERARMHLGGLLQKDLFRRPTHGVLLSSRERLKDLQIRMRSCGRLLRQKATGEEVELLRRRMNRAVLRNLRQQAEQLKNTSLRLEASSPASLTRRGFHPVLTPSGELLRNAQGLNKGDGLAILTGKNKIHTIVERVE